MSDKLDTLEAIRAAAHAELARAPKPRPWWVDALTLVFSNLVLGAIATLVLAPHLEQHSSEFLRWTGAAGLLLVAVGGAVAAVRPGARAMRLGVLALTGGSMLVLVSAASGHDPGVPFLGGSGCGALEAVYSLVPVVMSGFVLSKFAADPMRSVVGGLAAGAGGLLGLHFHCPNGTLTHLCCFHFIPWVLVSLAAVGVRRLFGTDSYAP